MGSAGFHHPFPRSEGRTAFGADPARYERARPGYPERAYALLEERCGLAPGAATLEIGPGPGTATLELLARGARPLVAVEPDERLAAHLDARLKAAGANATIHVGSFEDVALDPGSFDLAASATAFHWIEQAPGLARVRSLLRPGGWWAMWWMVFGDPDKPDPFHEATERLLQVGTGDDRTLPRPFCLEVEERTEDLARAGFRDVAFERVDFSLYFSPVEIRDLYASFSNITRLKEPQRERLLDDLVRVAEREFGGRVERQIVVACYTAQRPDGP